MKIVKFLKHWRPTVCCLKLKPIYSSGMKKKETCKIFMFLNIKKMFQCQKICSLKKTLKESTTLWEKWNHWKSHFWNCLLWHEWLCKYLRRKRNMINHKQWMCSSFSSFIPTFCMTAMYFKAWLRKLNQIFRKTLQHANSI